MGVTIFFCGTLRDPYQINDLVDEVKDICDIMKWQSSTLDDDWNKPADAQITHKGHGISIEGNLGLKGIGFQPHKDCEWVNMYFDSAGYLTTPLGKAMELEAGKKFSNDSCNSVKTQFAPLATHIAIVKLLKHLKSRYIPDLTVTDEGGYWESESIEILSERIGTISRAMDALEEGLKEVGANALKHDSIEEVIEHIDRILKEHRKKNG